MPSPARNGRTALPRDSPRSLPAGRFPARRQRAVRGADFRNRPRSPRRRENAWGPRRPFPRRRIAVAGPQKTAVRHGFRALPAHLRSVRGTVHLPRRTDRRLQTRTRRSPLRARTRPIRPRRVPKPRRAFARRTGRVLRAARTQGRIQHPRRPHEPAQYPQGLPAQPPATRLPPRRAR